MQSKIHILIDQYLSDVTEVSSIKLCDYLIQNHGLSNNKYSTGRPKLYFDVVLYLESLLKRDHLSVVSRDQGDCNYEVMSVLSGPNEPLENSEEKLGKVTDSQLSLF